MVLNFWSPEGECSEKISSGKYHLEVEIMKGFQLSVMTGSKSMAIEVRS